MKHSNQSMEFKRNALLLLYFFVVSDVKAEMSSFKKEALDIATTSNEKAAFYEKEVIKLNEGSFKKVQDIKEEVSLKKGLGCGGERLQERGGCAGVSFDELLEAGAGIPYGNDSLRGKEKKEILSNGVKLYVFISLSMPKEAIFALGKEAKKYGGVLVLQGFKEGDFKETFPFFKEYLEKVTPEQVTPEKVKPSHEGGGLVIDPPLFKKFKVTVVPSFVLEEEGRGEREDQQQSYDSVKGVMTISYALSLMKEKGVLREAASSLLKRGERP